MFSEENTPIKVFQLLEKLKLETRRELNLAFTIKCAVRTRNFSERGINGQNISAPGKERIVHTENVRPVGNIKSFSQKFESVSFFKSEAF